MASIISAGTTSGTALNMAGDTSGVLQLATNGTTTAVTISTAQNVGIGTTSPTAKLQVSRAGGSVGSTNLVYVDVTSSYGGVSINSTANNNTFVELMEAGTKVGGFDADTTNNVTSIQSDGGHVFAINTGGTTERMRIDTSGNLLVGTTTQSDTAKVTVKQTAGGSNYGISFVDNASNAAWIGSGGGPGLYFRAGAGNPVGTLNSSGNFVNASDIAYKENILPIQYGLDTVLDLSPKQYLIKANGINDIGFIAQDIEKIIPELVSGEEGSKGISYGQLTAVLVKAIQEQQTMIVSQSELITNLTARITALEGAA